MTVYSAFAQKPRQNLSVTDNIVQTTRRSNAWFFDEFLFKSSTGFGMLNHNFSFAFIILVWYIILFIFIKERRGKSTRSWVSSNSRFLLAKCRSPLYLKIKFNLFKFISNKHLKEANSDLWKIPKNYTNGAVDPKHIEVIARREQPATPVIWSLNPCTVRVYVPIVHSLPKAETGSHEKV